MAEVLLARIQRGLYPLGLVGRVGILLALQTYAHVLRIYEILLVVDIHLVAYTLEVTAIDLHTWLVGEHLHKDACLRRVEAGTYLCVITLAILESVQAEVVVIACGILNLVELRLDTVTQSMWGTEVHRCTLYRLDLTCGDVKCVAGSEVVGIYIKYHVVGGLCEVTTQVVVVVVGLIDDGRLVCLSR